MGFQWIEDIQETRLPGMLLLSHWESFVRRQSGASKGLVDELVDSAQRPDRVGVFRQSHFGSIVLPVSLVIACLELWPVVLANGFDGGEGHLPFEFGMKSNLLSFRDL